MNKVLHLLVIKIILKKLFFYKPYNFRSQETNPNLLGPKKLCELYLRREKGTEELLNLKNVG